MRIINLTEHNVSVECWTSHVEEPTHLQTTTFPVSGVDARVSELPDWALPDAVPVAHSFLGHPVEILIAEPVSYGPVSDLPDPDPGDAPDRRHYLVSTLVASAVVAASRISGTMRTDLLVPDTGPDSAIRDVRGQIVAVRRLRRVRT